jgi:hypothetical protein
MYLQYILLFCLVLCCVVPSWDWAKWKNIILWDVTPCSLVDRYQYLGWTHCLHQHGACVFISKMDALLSPKHWHLLIRVNVISQRITALVVTRVRTSNLTHALSFCVPGTVVLRPNQCSVFYSRRVFWFILLNQPDVGCGSVKLRRGGRDYAGGACEY